MEVLNFIKRIPKTLINKMQARTVKEKTKAKENQYAEYEEFYQLQKLHILKGKDVFDLSINAYEQYKGKVKDRDGVSYEDAQKLLTRNILLGVEYLPYKVIGNQRSFMYGNLCIFVNTKKNEIVYITNDRGSYCPAIRYVDKGYKKFLNKKFGIEEKVKVSNYINNN